MSFGEAVTACLNRYAGFTGRAARPEYWYFFLFLVLLNIGAGVLDTMLAAMGILPVVYLLVMLGTFLPALAVAVRRMHDMDRTGWWLLVGFVPLVGWIILLVWLAQAGTPGPNRFGPA